VYLERHKEVSVKIRSVRRSYSMRRGMRWSYCMKRSVWRSYCVRS
jgi:hypothetical protein